MKPLRLLLANHQPIVRNNLRFLLQQDATVQVVGEAANGREAIALADYQRPEIVLLDIQLPYVPGITAAREIAAKGTAAKIIFVSTLTDESYVQEAFKAGARGYVLGDTASTDLLTAIAAVAKGSIYLSPSISIHLLDAHKGQGSRNDSFWSDRDRQLFCWLAAGQDEEGIARSLNTNLSGLRAECDGLWNRLRRVGLSATILDSMQAGLATVNP